MSRTLHSIIVLADDRRGKRRPKANSTSNPYSVTRHRPTAERPLKAPGHNWAKALEKRHPILLARRVKALDWNRHEKNIYRKVTHWFEVIKDVLQDPAVLAENVYNMDETGVMLSMCDCDRMH
ncbi:hypothetical protein LARI1_G009559 [Lachnellula arida]|uniref:DDE-1 domain-containing protein n=1 Tax=Lachnellula arida TaxID=1316785 RepID=A0A8T9B255_9HELO|nr:hypothetical protein LARI1_G009559 [Lachnellula arida]